MRKMDAYIEDVFDEDENLYNITLITDGSCFTAQIDDLKHDPVTMFSYALIDETPEKIMEIAVKKAPEFFDRFQ